MNLICFCWSQWKKSCLTKWMKWKCHSVISLLNHSWIVFIFNDVYSRTFIVLWSKNMMFWRWSYGNNCLYCWGYSLIEQILSEVKMVIVKKEKEELLSVSKPAIASPHFQSEKQMKLLLNSEEVEIPPPSPTPWSHPSPWSLLLR